MDPSWLDKGDNSWQMLAGTLVGLQSVPGLVILYGSIVKKKWAVNSAFMALYAFAAVLVCWSLWGYQMSFGSPLLPILGKPGHVLQWQYMQSRGRIPFPQYAHFPDIALSVPMSTLIYYQFAFAALTVILVAGSVLGRMNFWAWMIFVPLWLTFSYTVGAYSLWGGGFLHTWGVLDFSGGYVIHVSSGVAGFVAAYWVGPRLAQDRERFPPNNVLLMLCGTGFLWLGWNGFNGGAPYSANQDASLALLNTNICAATALLAWTTLDILFFHKPSVIGAVQGMFAGLVCITPGAGLVQGWGAFIYGVASGTIPWFTMMKMHRQVRFLAQVDDTLGVVHTHAIAGVIGGLLTGVFAEPSLCAQFPCLRHNAKGATNGDWAQLGKQLVGALFVAGWNVLVTTIIMLFISWIVPLRMSEEQLLVGDDAAHGEEAYALWEDGPDKYIEDSIRSQHWNAEPMDVEMQPRHLVAIDNRQQLSQQQQQQGVHKAVVYVTQPTSTSKSSPSFTQ